MRGRREQEGTKELSRHRSAISINDSIKGKGGAKIINLERRHHFALFFSVNKIVMILHRYEWRQFVRDGKVCKIGNTIGSSNGTGIKRRTVLCIMWTRRDVRDEAATTKCFDSHTAKPSKTTCQCIARIRPGQCRGVPASIRTVNIYGKT